MVRELRGRTPRFNLLFSVFIKMVYIRSMILLNFKLSSHMYFHFNYLDNYYGRRVHLAEYSMLEQMQQQRNKINGIRKSLFCFCLC